MLPAMGDPLPPGQDSLQSLLDLHRDSCNENVASTSGSSSDAGVNLSQASVNESGLKRDYLRLLPISQIIEICLTFDPHVPIHVKSTLWPADLNAAIASLQLEQSVQTQTENHSPTDHPPEELEITRSTSPKPTDEDISQQANPPQPDAGSTEPKQSEPPVEPAEDPPIDLTTELAGSATDETEQTDSIVSAQQTLQKVLEELSRSTTPIQTAAAATSPVSPTPAPATATASQTEQPQASTSQIPAQSSTPQPSASSHTSTPQPAHPTHAVHPQAPYAYHPYGYPIPGQHAYPHTPYYGAPGYAAHYPGYPPYHPLPGYPAAPASMYGARPPMAHMPPPPHHPTTTPVAAPPPPPPTGDDLPSYEDMIVEALLDMPDTEGAAPRDLFTWMEARYPLQTNFRPSASQALQKAFKRGRLEKRPGGKYRLNATWEGGATTRRTTRRPQTLAQNNYNQHHPQSQSSPFTNAPLARGARGASATPSTANGQHSPYGAYPYGYPYGSYPGYPGYPIPTAHVNKPSTPASTSSAPTASSTTNTNKTTTEKTAPEKTAVENSGTSDGADHGDAWEAAQHILNVINFNSLQDAATSNSTGASTTLSDEHRTSLQAQLALLATQLSELAEMDEDEDIDENPTPAISTPPPPIVPLDQTDMLVDVNHLLEISQAAATQVDLPPPPDEIPSDDDSDEDMEMVEIS
ncbi:hypothetical protein QCA50_006719 [Cerrena zonata]|uniref:Histone H1 n=1 Tax=Cerrena zonata TaxID=2478898 RepID=A0AAW0G9F4_9APHY